ncbi:MAG: DNA-binding transcriptional regulator Fis [Pseudomonadota bacterium]|nr:DNA-binding transcriptional regulator Fis [Gammaproteobacteria bacterium]MBU1558680.1 DNA-binding transcriptional regulator Fis [Gammaproteobacteria bacterium]MBU1629196.1 DNA-binding transcriptional regulator Fis [Gammaproteobacteria bacterium]MBU1926584.1 DNA-binding transcriptional regulator Fis [Gammaproteobacteria bacterium]MBU2546515.1 DNA-binding transcriptional regulator Fis [Gammaproteobacteria bacterium]
MSTIESEEASQKINQHLSAKSEPLRNSVQVALSNYFAKLDGALVDNLYQMVLSEVEEPLLRAVMSHTKENQSKAAILLGLSRGTLRKKLKQYGLLD